MKKKILKWVIIISVLLTLIAIFNISRNRWVLTSQIERVEFRGYDVDCESPAAVYVTLTDKDARKLSFYYSFAFYAGEVNAEGCASDFGFIIHLKDGTKIHAREAEFSKIEIDLPNGTTYWLKSKTLTSYANKLVEKYQLPGPYPTGQ